VTPVTQTVIETSRLRLRRMSEADAAFIHRLVNDPSFIRNIGDKGVRTLEDARRYIRDGPRASYARHGFGLNLVELKTTGAPAGMCGLLKRDVLEHPDIGYAFVPEYWGAGYAGEAAEAVRAWARRDLGVRRVLAIVSPDNAASIRLLEKIGFSFERMTRLPGESADVAVYGWEAAAVERGSDL
jgi:ribosomal-protein-alanine N-acetyltransferase